MAKGKNRARTGDVKARLPSVPAQEGNHISFDYEKARFFRVIHVDGAVGSPTPKGDGIQMGLFSERVPIPKSEKYLIGADGRVGNRTGRDMRPGVYREVEVEAIMSVDVAKKLEEWLHQQIGNLEAIRAKGGSNA